MSETEIPTDLPEDQNDTPEKPQRRSVVAIVLGGVLIVFCLFVFSKLMAGFWDTPNSFFAYLMTFPAICFAWIAFRQYRALFSCEPSQMQCFSGCFFVTAVLAFILVVGLVNSNGNMLMPLITAVVSIFLGTVSVYNNRAHCRINDADSEPFGKHPPFRKRYWKRDVIGLLVMGLIVTGIMAYEISKIPPVYAKNVPYEQMYVRSRFPENGRDFCYIRGGRSTTTCEFTLDEQGFRDWTASWEYCRPIKEDDYFDFILTPSAYETGKYERYENPPVIADGLYAGYGSHCRAVFDRATNRVYYCIWR